MNAIQKGMVAVVPVRSGSQRLKNKNILPFADSNLLIHKIRQLKNVPNIDNIVVSSDSDEMLDMARTEKVSVHKRDIAYCDEKTKSFNDVVEHVATAMRYEHIMWSPCVCPLTRTEHFIQAVNHYYDLMAEENPSYDSVVSAKTFREYLYDERNQPVNFIPEKHVPSQQLPDWKIVTNGFYIASRENMIRWKYLYKKPFLILLNKSAAIDIDDEFDLLLARYIQEKYNA